MGGGLGTSHGNAETFPRIADVIGFITPEQLTELSRATHENFERYWHLRQTYYAREPRWPDSVFWRRRRGNDQSTRGRLTEMLTRNLAFDS